MYIDPKSKIAGIPALKIRDFLRKTENYNWSVEFFQESLHVSLQEAEQIVSKLGKLGYIEPVDRSKHERYWRITPTGSRFALATAAKPIRRSTADRIVKELIGRVRHVNQNKSYLYKITKIGVFGSYLTDQDPINDIDIAVILEPKEANYEKLQSLIWEKVAEEKENGRHFANFTEELFWPQIEILNYLKSRSKALSLQLLNEQAFEITESKVIYDIYDESTNSTSLCS